jgi:hypothetical protein
MEMILMLAPETINIYKNAKKIKEEKGKGKVKD